MFRTTQAFIDRLESDGLKYKLLGKTHGGDEAVSLVFGGDEDAAELHLLCIFAQNGGSAALRILRAVQVAEGRHLDALIALQDCNARYRFVKFCFPGEDERSVQMEMDVLFLPEMRPDLCADLCVKGMHLILGICAEAVPELRQLLS